MEEDKNQNPLGRKKSTPKGADNLDSAPGWEALEKRLNEMEKKPSYKISYWLEARRERSFYHRVSSLGAGLLGFGLGILSHCRWDVLTWLGDIHAALYQKIMVVAAAHVVAAFNSGWLRGNVRIAGLAAGEYFSTIKN